MAPQWQEAPEQMSIYRREKRETTLITKFRRRGLEPNVRSFPALLSHQKIVGVTKQRTTPQLAKNEPLHLTIGSLLFPSLRGSPRPKVIRLSRDERLRIRVLRQDACWNPKEIVAHCRKDMPHLAMRQAQDACATDLDYIKSEPIAPKAAVAKASTGVPRVACSISVALCPSPELHVSLAGSTTSCRYTVARNRSWRKGGVDDRVFLELVATATPPNC